MEHEIILITFRSTIAYIIMLILGRVIGRKMISQLTFFDFIAGVTLGSIAVRIALGPQESPFLATISVTVITILVVITDYLDIKSMRFRKLVDGDPVILVSNGKILDYNLKKVKITINKLMMQLREKDIFNIEDVAIALIESDGELTVLQKSNKLQKTSNINNLSGLMKDIIIDGKIIYENLESSNHDEQWLRNQLNNNNVKNIKEVFYAGLKDAENLYISTRMKQ